MCQKPGDSEIKRRDGQEAETPDVVAMIRGSKWLDIKQLEGLKERERCFLFCTIQERSHRLSAASLHSSHRYSLPGFNRSY